MAIEGLDGAPVLEDAGFGPLVAMPAVTEASVGPTLQAALEQAGQPLSESRTRLDEGALVLDLWVRTPGEAALVELRVGGNGAVSDPVLAASIEGETAAPQGDPLITKRLSPAEIGHPVARQYDSTDYYWEEMGAGDYEWALRNYQADIYAGVAVATSSATSAQEAAQMAAAYLASIGLSDQVHVNNPATGSGSEVIVTAPSTHQPSPFMPTLWMDTDSFSPFDAAQSFEPLDVSAITVSIDMDRPLTGAEQSAVNALRHKIEFITTVLNSMPANGVFTYPDGQRFTVQQLRQLWAHADFIVVDHPFNTGTESSPGMGAAHWNGGNPIFEVAINALRTQFMVNDGTRRGTSSMSWRT